MNKIFYFTSTGNSLYIAKEIQKKIGGELISIPKALKEKKLDYSGEKIGIIYPCYAWQTPPNVREFIEKTSLEGGYIFSIMTYGKMAVGGVNEFDKLCKENNVELSYTNKILMVDNYITGFDMDKQVANIGKKNIEENLSSLCEDIINERSCKDKTNILKNLLSSNIYKIAENAHRKMPEKFEVEDSCTSCGICEKVCPVDNIKVEEKPKFSDKCIACFGCTHNCPVNAIRVKSERSKARFRNKNIELKEIIDSNS